MTRTCFKGLLVLLIACRLAWPQDSPKPGSDGGELEQRFHAPADADKPWAYWWWLNANVTRESITRDLEGMKAKGLGGFLLFDVTEYGHHLVPPPPRHVEFMSPQWRELVRFAMSEADRLGLQMSMNLSTCGGSLKAPWEMGEHSPKQLIWTSAEVTGPARATCRLGPPEAQPFWPVALVAARCDEAARRSTGKDAVPRRPTTGRHAAPVEVNLSGPWSPVLETSHRAAHLTLPKDAPVVTEVVDLTAKVDAEGRLVWDVPEGRWTLLCFGCNPIADRGNDVDILSSEAVDAHFERMAGAILADAGPLAGKTLTHFYNVSWEGTSPSWTPGFDKEFQKHRGYAIRPYLPALAGFAVTSREVSLRFQADYSRTLSECFLHNCYERFTELCHQAGLRWHSESGGPWRDSPLFSHGDQLAFWGRNDMPQGEFWWPSATKTNARRAAMAAHIYGKPLVSIEAFTHMQAHWSAYPASLKPLADAAFCDGVNQFVWHTSTASPPEFGTPGIVYFAGTHLNPNVTWWRQAGPFLDYLARCQHMLRQGKFVADVCCYTTNRNRKNWGRDKTWGEKTSLELPPGYSYDLINTEVLLTRLSVDRGDLVLPDGMRYRLLVVDLEEDIVPPEALRKVLELAEAGATVVLGKRRPVRAPGLKNYPACDERVARLTAELWGDGAASARRRSPDLAETAGSGDPRTARGAAEARPRTVGRGKVVCPVTMDQVLRAEGILPDFVGPSATASHEATPWDYIHRRGDGCDIYFLAGSGGAECTFRVGGKTPELWDPVTGERRDATDYRAAGDGRTVVPLRLPENGSVFVVFRKPAPRQAAESTRSEDGPEAPEIRPVPGPWRVSFASALGTTESRSVLHAPESAVFDQLTPWNEHPNRAIKHFSGTATYRKTLTLSQQQAGGPVRLRLGQVSHVASVRLNGEDLGVVWTAPWAVELTGRAKAGANELEIDVTNLWVNRLIGDAALPEDRRLTKTNVVLQKGERTLKPYQAYGSKDPLATSGLLGPVQLEFGPRGR